MNDKVYAIHNSSKRVCEECGKPHYYFWAQHKTIKGPLEMIKQVTNIPGGVIVEYVPALDDMVSGINVDPSTPITRMIGCCQIVQKYYDNMYYNSIER